MPLPRPVFLAACLAVNTLAGAADPAATVDFREAAPMDLFTVVNDSAPGIRISELWIDLVTSAGDVLFDPEQGGAGVLSVYPFTVTEGGEATGFLAVTGDTDGSRLLGLRFDDFDPGERLVFGIDVDDRMAGGVPVQNRITGDELAGSRVRVRFCLAAGGAVILENVMAANRVRLGADGTITEASPAPAAGCSTTQGADAMILNFRDDSLRDWRVVNDGVMGGMSRSRFHLSAAGTGVFEGEVSLENNGGFASVRLPVTTLDLSAYTGLVIRHRGDGQRYRLRLHDNPRMDSIAYQADFQTGPDWQETRLPFEAFRPTFRGRTPPDAPALDTTNIQQLGLMIADKQAGPFLLEVERVSAY